MLRFLWTLIARGIGLIVSEVFGGKQPTPEEKTAQTLGQSQVQASVDAQSAKTEAAVAQAEAQPSSVQATEDSLDKGTF